MNHQYEIQTETSTGWVTGGYFDEYLWAYYFYECAPSKAGLRIFDRNAGEVIYPPTTKKTRKRIK